MAEVGGTRYTPGRSEVIVDPATGRNFDFELLPVAVGEPIALEIFRLTEDDATMRTRHGASQVLPLIQQELRDRGVKSAMVFAPRLSFKKASIQRFAAEQAKVLHTAINDAAEDEDRFTEQGYTIRRTPEIEEVYVVGNSEGGFYDGAGRITSKLEEVLPRKNSQLAIDGFLRYILVLNSSIFGDSEDFIKASAAFDFSQFKNIDRILFETRQGEIRLVFDRSVYNSLNDGHLPPPKERQLYRQQLNHQLLANNPNAFRAVRERFDDLSLLGILTDEIQESTVMCASSFLKQGQKEPAIWAINKFADIHLTAAERDLHRKILSGERIPYIVGAHSQVCWLVYQLLYKDSDEHIEQFIKVITMALTNENLYLRTQAAIGLIGLTWRRCVWVDGVWILPEAMRMKIRDLAFTSVRENRDFPAVIEVLIQAFQWIRDITEHEALELQDIFSTVTERDALQSAVYFDFFLCFWRPRWEPEFRPGSFLEGLKATLSGASERRRVGAWVLSRELEAGNLTLVETRDIIDALFFSTFQGEAALHVYAVVKTVLKLDANYGFECFYRALEQQSWPIEGHRFSGAYQIEDILRQIEQSGDQTRLRTALDVICQRLHPNNRHFFPFVSSHCGGTLPN